MKREKRLALALVGILLIPAIVEAHDWYDECHARIADLDSDGDDVEITLAVDEQAVRAGRRFSLSRFYRYDNNGTYVLRDHRFYSQEAYLHDGGDYFYRIYDEDPPEGRLQYVLTGDAGWCDDDLVLFENYGGCGVSSRGGDDYVVPLLLILALLFLSLWRTDRTP